ncbi:MAG TPA: heme ABC transporter ATP-binding protein, partial [Flexilinea sp.]|nr:heme ABC transporter ATP-binding protein [Flexilinea sp.]
MISLSDVSVHYGDQPVVQNISFDIRQGKVMVLIGPNGSGKTTIIRGITGSVKLSGGQIKYDGKNLADLSETERAKYLSVVPQNSLLPDGFSVYETVAMGRTPYLGLLGKLSEEDRRRVDEAIRETAISDLRKKDVRSLSGGEQQRVILARALAQDTPVMILDEPTTHLDLNHTIGILSLVRNLSREKGTAVLIVLHDLNLAARFADEIIILKQGNILAMGTPEEVLTENNLTTVYHVPMIVFRHDGISTPIVLPK